MTSDEGVTIQRQSPEEAFGLLSNDLRVDILQAFGEVDPYEHPGGRLIPRRVLSSAAREFTGIR